VFRGPLARQDVTVRSLGRGGDGGFFRRVHPTCACGSCRSRTAHPTRGRAATPRRTRGRALTSHDPERATADRKLVDRRTWSEAAERRLAFYRWVTP